MSTPRIHQLVFKPSSIATRPVGVLLPEDATLLTVKACGELQLQLWYYASTLSNGDFATKRVEYDIFTVREYDKVPFASQGRRYVWFTHVQLKALHYHVFVPDVLRSP